MANFLVLLHNELSVRIDPRGGKVRKEVQAGPDGGASGHGVVILLLHGYANTLQDARDSYATFEGHYNENEPESARVSLPDTFRFYWPGDTKLFRPVYYLSYPTEIKPAKHSARVLAEYLRNLPPPPGGVTNVYLIGHSLGNRVVLELVKQFVGEHARARLQFQGIFMMAAAVPVAKLRNGGKLHDAAKKPGKRWVLHSQSDLVLKLGFPLGEIAGFDAAPWPWDWPEAVGRYGKPSDNWTFNRAMFQQDGKGYGHSDYWPGMEVPPLVAEFLGRIGSNEIFEAVIPANTIGGAPAPASAQIGTRGTPSRPAFG